MFFKKKKAKTKTDSDGSQFVISHRFPMQAALESAKMIDFELDDVSSVDVAATATLSSVGVLPLEAQTLPEIVIGTEGTVSAGDAANDTILDSFFTPTPITLDDVSPQAVVVAEERETTSTGSYLDDLAATLAAESVTASERKEESDSIRWEVSDVSPESVLIEAEPPADTVIEDPLAGAEAVSLDLSDDDLVDFSLEIEADAFEIDLPDTLALDNGESTDPVSMEQTESACEVTDVVGPVIADGLETAPSESVALEPEPQQDVERVGNDDQIVSNDVEMGLPLEEAGVPDLSVAEGPDVFLSDDEMAVVLDLSDAQEASDIEFDFSALEMDTLLESLSDPVAIEEPEGLPLDSAEPAPPESEAFVEDESFSVESVSEPDISVLDIANTTADTQLAAEEFEPATSSRADADIADVVSEPDFSEWEMDVGAVLEAQKRESADIETLMSGDAFGPERPEVAYPLEEAVSLCAEVMEATTEQDSVELTPKDISADSLEPLGVLESEPEQEDSVDLMPESVLPVGMDAEDPMVEDDLSPLVLGTTAEDERELNEEILSEPDLEVFAEEPLELTGTLEEPAGSQLETHEEPNVELTIVLPSIAEDVDFSFALTDDHDDRLNDSESPTGEPMLIRDDVTMTAAVEDMPLIPDTGSEAQKDVDTAPEEKGSLFTDETIQAVMKEDLAPEVEDIPLVLAESTDKQEISEVEITAEPLQTVYSEDTFVSDPEDGDRAVAEPSIPMPKIALEQAVSIPVELPIIASVPSQDSIMEERIASLDVLFPSMYQATIDGLRAFEKEELEIQATKLSVPPAPVPLQSLDPEESDVLMVPPSLRQTAPKTEDEVFEDFLRSLLDKARQEKAEKDDLQTKEPTSAPEVSQPLAPVEELSDVSPALTVEVTPPPSPVVIEKPVPLTVTEVSVAPVADVRPAVERELENTDSPKPFAPFISGIYYAPDESGTSVVLSGSTPPMPDTFADLLPIPPKTPESSSETVNMETVLTFNVSDFTPVDNMGESVASLSDLPKTVMDGAPLPDSPDVETPAHPVVDFELPLAGLSLPPEELTEPEPALGVTDVEETLVVEQEAPAPSTIIPLPLPVSVSKPTELPQSSHRHLIPLAPSGHEGVVVRAKASPVAAAPVRVVSFFTESNATSVAHVPDNGSTSTVAPQPVMQTSESRVWQESEILLSPETSQEPSPPPDALCAEAQRAEEWFQGMEDALSQAALRADHNVFVDEKELQAEHTVPMLDAPNTLEGEERDPLQQLAEIELPPFEFGFSPVSEEPEAEGGEVTEWRDTEAETSFEASGFELDEIPSYETEVFPTFNFDEPAEILHPLETSPIGAISEMDAEPVEGLDILASSLLTPELKLLLVRHDDLVALMVDNGENAAVLKTYDTNPLAEQEEFVVAEEAMLGSKILFVVTVGYWQGIISVESDEITLQAEL